MDVPMILGQAYPAATTLTTVYTCPASTTTTVSSFTACNQTGSAAYFYMSVVPGGVSDAPSQYIYSNLYIDPYDTFIAVIGITLQAGDQLRVYSTVVGLSFSFFGVQTS